MLVYTRRNGEYIRVKNNVLGRKANFVDQNIVAALTDIRFAFKSVCLAVFVKGHDDYRRAIF